MSLPAIGITMGDPTGIGPEIIAKALSTEGLYRICRPIVFGDPAILARTLERLGLPSRVEVISSPPERGFSSAKILLFASSHLDPDSVHFGHPDRVCGEAMVRYIIDAVQWVKDGRLQALTTCPINKQAMNLAGHPFSGHTELLAHLVQSPRTAMMFLGKRWKVILVTTHLPLKEISNWITRERVFSTIQMAHQGLRQFFSLSSPRIAVLGLNPHCGEEGLLGEEEEKAILPAIEEARQQGIDVQGPFPGDSFFDLSAENHFDVTVAMYHDQGLIPVKMVDFREAVNFTLGLPFVRTSVAHGTAYDIAGQGLADPTNLVKAIRTAAELSEIAGHQALR